MKIKGFSLIELMIVITIIGILAAVAVPAYQSYTVRAKITDALSMLNMGRNHVAEYHTVNGKLPTLLSDMNLTTSQFATPVVKSMNYLNGNGGLCNNCQYFYVYLESDVVPGITIPELTLLITENADNSLSFSCHTTPSTHAGSIPQQYLPAGCKVGP